MKPNTRDGMSVQTHQLTKRFGPTVVVDQLNLNLDPGESYGFLGPNGAGKTTTLLMLLGIHQPTSGEVQLDGQPVRSNSFALKRRIGVVAENQASYDAMSAFEYLEFIGRLYQVPRAAARASQLLDQVGLSPWRDLLIGSYSTGMRKKLGFVAAVLPAPDLLILDEPVSGLDPFGMVQIRELLQVEKQAGCTLLISSHILSEVERMVERVGIIASGRLLVEDTMENVRRRAGETQIVHVRLSGFTDRHVQAMRQLRFVRKVEVAGNRLKFWIDVDREYLQDIGEFFLKHQLVVLEMTQEDVSLEQAFITLTEHNLGDLTESFQEGQV